MRVSLIVLGLIFSGAASAVQFTNTGTQLRTTDCVQLNENVTINLSNNVVAGATCAGTSIVFAACHSGGQQKNRSSNVTTCVNTDGDANTGVNGNEDCTTAVQTVTGPAMPRASTAAGTVVPGYPAGACTAAAAETFTTAP